LSSRTCSRGRYATSSGQCVNRLFRDQFGSVTPIFDASRQPGTEAPSRIECTAAGGGRVDGKGRSFGMFVAFPWSKRGVLDDIRDPPT
jgi:hypothetical protein